MTIARFMLVSMLLAARAMPAQALDPVPLVIEGKARQELRIDIVDSEPERARGLMHRTDVPEDYGMLFVFDETKPIGMWMKNTPHPLDMLFIDGGGRVSGIAADTVPNLETVIPSPGPVRAVLEVAAGTARRLGLAPGDRVVHPRLPADEKDRP